MVSATNLPVTPFDVGKKFKIVYADTIKQARYFQRLGYIPIECSFGNESVVDERYVMDHHGPYSHLDSVAIRAYRDFFGCCRDNPKFVVTGFPDEDATFAICALTGCIPHPSMADRYPNAPLGMLQTARQNVLHIAELIAEADVDPDSALSLLDTFFGRLVLNWRLEAHPTARDIVAWYGGVNNWRNLLTIQGDGYIEASKDVQAQRFQKVLGASREECGGKTVVVDFSEFGPNSAYYRKWFEVTDYDVLVAFIGGPTGLGNCSFVGRDYKTVKRRYGKGGFKAIYDKLVPGGSGGREIIGGSRRGGFFNWDTSIKFGLQLRELAV